MVKGWLRIPPPAGFLSGRAEGCCQWRWASEGFQKLSSRWAMLTTHATMGSTLTVISPNFLAVGEGVQQFSVNFCLMNFRRTPTLTQRLWGHQWGLNQEDTPVNQCTQVEEDTLAREAILATTTQAGLLIQGRTMVAIQATRVSTSTSSSISNNSQFEEFDNFYKKDEVHSSVMTTQIPPKPV